MNCARALEAVHASLYTVFGDLLSQLIVNKKPSCRWDSRPYCQKL